MQLSWEAVTAATSLFSSLAVLAAVIVAVRQVRVGADQVEHLRRATQLEGTMKIFDKLGSPEQQRARTFIVTELGGRLEDPVFRAELERVPFTYEGHPEIDYLRLMEMIGTYVKHGLLDSEIIFDYWYGVIIAVWSRLESLGVVAVHRRAAGALMWENCEALYHQARAWAAVRDPAFAARHARAANAGAGRDEVVADASAG